MMRVCWKNLDTHDEVYYNGRMASIGRHILSVTYFAPDSVRGAIPPTSPYDTQSALKGINTE